MNVVALSFTCLACVGSGRRVHIAADPKRGLSHEEHHSSQETSASTISSDIIAEWQLLERNREVGVPSALRMLRELLLLNDPAAASKKNSDSEDRSRVKLAAELKGSDDDRFAQLMAHKPELQYEGKDTASARMELAGSTEEKKPKLDLRAVAGSLKEKISHLMNHTALHKFKHTFQKVISGDCRQCLKECLGTKIKAAQLAGMKIQGPLTVVYMLILGNRPIKMFPIELALQQIAELPAGLFGALAAAAYGSCRNDCDADCSYPGDQPPDPFEAPLLPELESVDPTDTSFLDTFYQPQKATEEPTTSAGKAFSGLKKAFGEIFQIPGLEEQPPPQ